MAYKPIRMKDINHMRHYHFVEGKGIKEVSRLLGISRNTVRSYVRRIKQLGLDTSKDFDEEQLAQLYSATHQTSSFRHSTLDALLPSYVEELGRVGVTRELLYEQYLSVNPQGYSYAHFCRLIRQYKRRYAVSMHLDHQAGQVLQVDYAGKKISYLDDQGQQRWAEVLICTMPYSGCTYSVVMPSQQLEDFVRGIATTLHHLTAVPAVLYSDNLRSYVVKSDRYSPTFTNLCKQLSAHYGMEMDAARVAKPKDKASVERHVQVVYHQVYAPLRDEHFTSIDQINTAMQPLLKKLNDKARKSKPRSRYDEYHTQERPLMRTLPSQEFSISKSTVAKVNSMHHVWLGEDKHSYSVPYQYVGQKTEIV